VADPHRLTLAEIRRLDRWQVLGIYLAPRDERGSVLATGAAQPRVSTREGFARRWRLLGLPAWRVEELWAAEEAKAMRRREESRARQKRKR